MVVLLAVILVVVIAFSLFTARSLYRARDVRRLKAREEAEMIEVTGQWIIQGRAASRPVRSARRPYKMPTYPPDIAFISEQKITGPHKLKKRR